MVGHGLSTVAVHIFLEGFEIEGVALAHLEHGTAVFVHGLAVGADGIDVCDVERTVVVLDTY